MSAGSSAKQVRPPLVPAVTLEDGSVVFATWDGRVGHRKLCPECDGEGSIHVRVDVDLWRWVGQCERCHGEKEIEEFDCPCDPCDLMEVRAMAAGLGRQA